MSEAGFLFGTLSFLILLTISTFTFLFSKKYNLPYTVLLILVGLLLVPLSGIEAFSFINSFKLTPEVLFYVFLPVLLFESAYNIHYRQLIKNWKSITVLAVFGLIIATLIIGTGLYFLLPLVGFEVPFLVCLLFGSLISATDPVAVLALFKSMGAPRRLALIFEGESLFNDGTAYAFFTVILGVILAIGSAGSFSIIGLETVTNGSISFLTNIFFGIIFGLTFGVLFSKIIGKIRNSESTEIVLTMVLAHLTFVLAELITHYAHSIHLPIQVSGIIATTMSAIVIGNYGRYKISPKVEHHMEKFWGFFAFIANSIVFILLGLTVSHLNVDFEKFIAPTAVAIGVVLIARAISVYFPIGFLNRLNVEKKIPMSWQHLLSWGSLRGALALVLVFSVPDDLIAFEKVVGWTYDFSIKDFLVVLTISSIFFTMFIKATTIGPIMRLLQINKLKKLEEFEYDESKILITLKVLEKLKKTHEKGYIVTEEYDVLRMKYELKLREAVEDIKNLLDGQGNESYLLIYKALSLHALGIEKKALKELFEYNEIDEKTFKYILHKIERQTERLEEGKSQLKTIQEKNEYDFFERAARCVSMKKETILDRYIRNRTKVVVINKVIRELNELKEIDFGFDSVIFDDVIALYQRFLEMAEEKLDIIVSKNETRISMLDVKMVDKSLLKLEEKLVQELYNKEIITPKLFIKFNEEIENEISKDVRVKGEF